jgi:steroid delta-isomerase-like uncharacterized protein
MTEENKKAIRRIVEEVFENGAMNVIDELIAEDFLDHSLQHSRFFAVTADREGFRQLVREVRAGLSDLEVSVDLIVAEGDLVAARVNARAVHSGQFWGVPATGKSIDLTDYHYFRFENGKIREHWNQINALEVMQQLGVVGAL